MRFQLLNDKIGRDSIPVRVVPANGSMIRSLTLEIKGNDNNQLIGEISFDNRKEMLSFVGYLDEERNK